MHLMFILVSSLLSVQVTKLFGCKHLKKLISRALGEPVSQDFSLLFKTLQLDFKKKALW